MTCFKSMMTRAMRIGIAVGFLCLLIVHPSLAEDRIASQYPGDKGIDQDPAVIFWENFDSASLDAVAKRWESIQDKSALSLSSDVPEGSVEVVSDIVVRSPRRRWRKRNEILLG